MSTSGNSATSAAPVPAAIAPEDSFLVQIRGGSRVADRAVSGRIEHLYSGISEAFGSLAELFEFLDRHFGRPGPGSGDDTPTSGPGKETLLTGR